MMKIDEGSTKTPHQKSRDRKRFISQIKSPLFDVAVFTFKRPGAISNWVSVCKMPKGDTKESDGFVGFVAEASRKAPLLLSRRQTRDAVSAIATATGKGHRMSRAILSASLPDGTIPQFGTPQEENSFCNDLTKLILQLQCDEEAAMDDIVDDMRQFNGKAGKTKFDQFWKGATEVLESQNGSGAQRRRHAASDERTTIDVQYAPGILSVPQLVQDTRKYLVDDKKLVEGVDFHVPCLSWVYLQLSPNNEFKRTASRYTGKIPFKLMLQTRDARDYSHICAHWVSGMKKMWRHEMSDKFRLIQEYINSVEHDDESITTCLPPQHAIMCIGDDDKASVPVGRTVPVSATSKQSSRAIVKESSRASDHDWSCESHALTVLQHMNISENPNDSQYSGGKDGTGFVTVSVHDRTLNPSTGLQHSANIYDYISRLAKERCNDNDDLDNNDDADNITEERWRRCCPYILHIETDGGPDHNFTFLRNTMALFGLFLTCNVDKMTATRCCPGLSFLNIVERAMSLINMGISSLSLAIDPNAAKFLVDEVMKGMSSMKNVRESIADYDEAVQVAIQILERQLSKMSSVNEESTSNSEEPDEMEIDSSGITSKIDDKVIRFFPYYGRFEGTVIEINENNIDGKPIRIKFEDGEVADYSQQEVDEFSATTAIPLGEVGFVFVRKFGSAGYFNGTIIEKKRNGKLLCEFHDGARHQYSLDEIEQYAKTKVQGDIESDTSSSSSSSEESEVESEESDSEEESTSEDESNNNNGNGGTSTDNTTTTPQIKRGPHFHRHLNNLKRVPAGVNIEDHVSNLKDRQSAKDAFTSAMEVPKKQIESRCANLSLDGKPVRVIEYPTNEESTFILDALKDFDSDFDPSLTSMSQLKKMSVIHEFLTCPNHCHRTDFSLEFRLCGNSTCHLCQKIGRSVRTPDVEVNGRKLRDEMLRFNSFPIVDAMNEGHYMPPAEALKHIASKRISFEEQKKLIPSATLDKDGADLKRRREKDKKQTFHATKVRADAKCKSCGATRCIYSKHMIGKPGGPTMEELQTLEREIENIGYICGDKMSGYDGGTKCFSRRAIRCGEPIEAHFYDPNTGSRGGRRVTSAERNICAICYVNDEILSKDEIRQGRDLGGKTPLPMCRDCFDSGVKPACSGARVNVMQATAQNRRTKRRQRSQNRSVQRNVPRRRR